MNADNENLATSFCAIVILCFKPIERRSFLGYMWKIYLTIVTECPINSNKD